MPAYPPLYSITNFRGILPRSGDPILLVCEYDLLIINTQSLPHADDLDLNLIFPVEKYTPIRDHGFIYVTKSTQEITRLVNLDDSLHRWVEINGWTPSKKILVCHSLPQSEMPILPPIDVTPYQAVLTLANTETLNLATVYQPPNPVAKYIIDIPGNTFLSVPIQEGKIILGLLSLNSL